MTCTMFTTFYLILQNLQNDLHKFTASYLILQNLQNDLQIHLVPQRYYR